MDSFGKDKRRWTFWGAYPIKWTGPELKASSNAIAFESIEMVHQGISTHIKNIEENSD